MSAKTRGSSPYLTLFRLPGAKGFCTAAALARMPISMMGLGIVLALNHIYNNWTSAGLMSAVFTLSAALVTPFYARLFDRFGQRRVGLVVLSVQIVAMLAFALGALNRIALGALFVMAIVMGLTQFSFGALVRTRWAWALGPQGERGEELLNTAYALESGVDECVFILGPILAAWLATSVNPVAQLFVPIAALLVGGLIFFSLRSTEPPAVTRVPQSQLIGAGGQGAVASPVDAGGVVKPGAHQGRYKPRSAMSHPVVLLLFVIFVVFNMSFSAVDVTVTALTKQMGRESIVGLQLSLIAAGSLCGALIFGSVKLRGSRWRYLTLYLTLLTIGFIGFRLTMGNLLVLGAVELVTGLCVSPIYAIGNLIVRGTVDSSALTEGLSWLSTGSSIGSSLGSTLAGMVLDTAGPAGGMMIPWIVTACAVPLALVGWAFNRHPERAGAGSTNPSVPAQR
ncbi:MFS superfamily transporter [Bifidobacterium actinocoloniiforme DSM 22766]|uniref:MFS superfamily transporter n=1 Tax=Bifidobacterium actinocoloniiforme DSM 22766 TaxID=1437605 RepID=A0A086YZH2_9BIFI|nr:MFS transporter [Bifidobacterium actinocoloniiforme]AKV55001.1 MFS transporter [Bifidobacterium actinocoloniiforme DSM 22766]KFI39672.1 MFS superfamily transporter [Bifidobacterium actinocoloniiforme DSM 22766]